MSTYLSLVHRVLDACTNEFKADYARLSALKLDDLAKFLRLHVFPQPLTHGDNDLGIREKSSLNSQYEPGND